MSLSRMSSSSSSISKTLSSVIVGTATIAAIYALYKFGKEIQSTMDEEKKKPEVLGGSGSGCPMGIDQSQIQGESALSDSAQVSMGCPMMSGGNNDSAAATDASHEPQRHAFQPSSAKGFSIEAWTAKNYRMIGLYEDFIFLKFMQESWYQPGLDSTHSNLRAALQGIECSLMILSTFVGDTRYYVSKRARVELVTKDISQQCQLLATMSNEFEAVFSAHCKKPSSHSPIRTHVHHHTLETGNNWSTSDVCTTGSGGLQLITDTLKQHFTTLSTHDQQVMRTMIVSIYSSILWLSTVYKMNTGLEPQLRYLVHLVRAEDLYDDCDAWLNNKKPILCYEELVDSQRVASLRVKGNYEHYEDLFFRFIHLGTEMWGKVAVSYLEKAFDLAKNDRWKESADNIEYAADMLNYLGSHVLTLTSMNIRDYLVYKPEIYGTSGEGSIVVKCLRGHVTRLFDPLTGFTVRWLKRLGGGNGPAYGPAFDGSGMFLRIPHRTGEALESYDRCKWNQHCKVDDIPIYALDQAEKACMSEEEQQVFACLCGVYTHPDIDRESSDVYAFCKALELVESAVMSGFYHRHFVLANNVIGSLGKGTLHKGVQALRSSYSTGCFPILDQIRYSMAKPIDLMYIDKKANIVNLNAVARGWPKCI